MFCSKCAKQSDVGERFCRKCGNDLEGALLPKEQNSLNSRFATTPSKDPDELIGSGVAAFFIGDGFFFSAILLSVTNTSVSSLLWLLLLIPAFFFFGKGFADVFTARQIRRRLKQNELNAASTTADLPPPRATVVDVLKQHNSGDLIPSPSVTERTTRQLK